MASIKNASLAIALILPIIVFVQAAPFIYLRDNGAEVLQPSVPVNYVNNGVGFLPYPLTSTIFSNIPAVVQIGGVQPFVNGFGGQQVITNGAQVEIVQ